MIADARDIEARVIEAAYTESLLPRVHGPHGHRCSWPAALEEWTAYAAQPSRYTLRATPAAIDRMMETIGWINSILPEEDRRFLYKWAMTKAGRGKRLGRLAEDLGINERTMRRHIIVLCQRLVDGLSRDVRFRLTAPFDAVSQIGAEPAAFEVASDNRAPERHKAYHRADDAVPAHVPGSEPEIARYIETVNRQRREEAERQRQAALRRAEDAARLAAKIKARRRKAA
jgi:hypothetical protein